MPALLHALTLPDSICPFNGKQLKAMPGGRKRALRPEVSRHVNTSGGWSERFFALSFEAARARNGAACLIGWHGVPLAEPPRG
jgi:hypothetical protein